MELFQAHDHYIIQDGEYSLWCNRFDGKISARTGADLCNAWNPVCLGCVEGVVGKLQIHPEGDWRLVLIRSRTLVGCLPSGHDVYRIDKVVVIPLSPNEPQDIEIELCKKHHFGMKRTERITPGNDSQQKALAKTWNSIKTVAGQVKNRKKESRDREKFERRILEEIYRMFNDNDSFYYCPDGDLTNSIQRTYVNKHDANTPAKDKIDDRFFWNKHMLQDLIDFEGILGDHWIVPIIQGYVQIEETILDFSEDDDFTIYSPFLNHDFPMKKDPVSITISLISRRSRHRAGTRYQRRGVDDLGKVANYVETEQIIATSHHTVAFVQTRGSVPAYWSQHGFKYRPPPRLERTESETQTAFERHFEEEILIYRRQAIVNLLEQTGREKLLGDAYMKHIVNFNSPYLIYVTFDFHEYCHGMKFENVSVLTESINDVIREIRYCWVDSKGVICDQRGVFRVNCLDCLDRTNVVQCAIARIVMETQLRKLGLMLPEQNIPSTFRRVYNQMWANNGDLLSRQYAGTVALKGDYTRTGERKIAGVMKDGVNSANRFYLDRFKAAYRQLTIDLMLGQAGIDDINSITNNKSPDSDEELWSPDRDDNVKQLIQHCKKLILPDTEICYGGWALIDCDAGSSDPALLDIDLILMLTNKAYYVARYDVEAEKVTQYQQIPLETIEQLEIGPEPSLFVSKFTCMRIHYTVNSNRGYFTMMRPACSVNQDARGVIDAIAEVFQSACAVNNLPLLVVEGKLDRKSSKDPENISSISAQTRLNAWARARLPRNASDGALPTRKQSSPRVNVAKSYIRDVRNKISNLNPIQKIKTHKLTLELKVARKKTAVAYHKTPEITEEQRESLDGEGVMAGDGNSDTSSETTESYDNLSMTDIDKVAGRAAARASGRMLGATAAEDDDIVLETCGIVKIGPNVRRYPVATTLPIYQTCPSSQSSFRRYNSEGSVVDMCYRGNGKDLSPSERGRGSKEKMDASTEWLDLSEDLGLNCHGPAGLDGGVIDPDDSPRLGEMPDSVQRKRSEDAESVDSSGSRVEFSIGASGGVDLSTIIGTDAVEQECEEDKVSVEGESEEVEIQHIHEDDDEAGQVDDTVGSLTCPYPLTLPPGGSNQSELQRSSGTGAAAPRVESTLSFRSDLSFTDADSLEVCLSTGTSPMNSPTVEIHIEDTDPTYPIPLDQYGTLGRWDLTPTAGSSPGDWEVVKDDSVPPSVAAARGNVPNPFTKIREQVMSLNIKSIGAGSRRRNTKQAQLIESLEKRLRSRHCLTRFIQL